MKNSNHNVIFYVYFRDFAGVLVSFLFLVIMHVVFFKESLVSDKFIVLRLKFLTLVFLLSTSDKLIVVGAEFLFFISNSSKLFVFPCTVALCEAKVQSSLADVKSIKNLD